MIETTRDVTVAHTPFRLHQLAVRSAMAGVLAEPLKDHYVVIDGRRYPPKQVLAVVTGLRRSSFTSHQALRILRNLGFSEGRQAARVADVRPPVGEPLPAAAEQTAVRQRPSAPLTAVRQRPSAEALEPHVGEWVAVRGTEVLVGAPSAGGVVSWLNRHHQKADSMFRVPRDELEASGVAPA